MKKAKIMLAAIAVIGAVGGALALTSSKGPLLIYTYGSDFKCDNPATILDYTTVPGGLPFTTTASLTPMTTFDSTCPVITVYSE